MADFDAQIAMTVGGWDARFARVIDVQVDGDVAAALIDSNGDGADLNVDIYQSDGDGNWTNIASSNGSFEIAGVRATWTDDDRLLLSRTSG